MKRLLPLSQFTFSRASLQIYSLRSFLISSSPSESPFSHLRKETLQTRKDLGFGVKGDGPHLSPECTVCSVSAPTEGRMALPRASEGLRKLLLVRTSFTSTFARTIQTKLPPPSAVCNTRLQAEKRLSHLLSPKPKTGELPLQTLAELDRCAPHPLPRPHHNYT